MLDLSVHQGVFVGLKKISVFAFAWLISFQVKASICDVLFLVSEAEVNQKNTNHYLQQIEKDSVDHSKHQPKFIDREQEKKLSLFWSGTREVPKLIKKAITDMGSVLNFPLLNSDRGSVKTSNPAQFVSFRLKHTWRGKVMDTNVGVPAPSLMPRLNGDSKWLVDASKNVKAVVMFDHGGGTTTTGHHITFAMANHFLKYGIVILGIDNPDHAYGSREEFKNYRELIEYKLDFRKQFISPEVPVFYAGHSWGAQLADIMMRLSDQPELKVHELIAGIMSFSPPLDSAPGKSLQEKWAADEAIGKMDYFDLLPQYEKDLPGQLLEAGKNNMLAWQSLDRLAADTNWQKPEHNGAKYVPTLHVMGERDFLYLGSEKIYQEYVKDLQNVEVHMMGERLDVYGNRVPIGHLIFDHYVWIDKKTGQMVAMPESILNNLKTSKKKMDDIAFSDPNLEPVLETVYTLRKFVEGRLQALGKLAPDEKLAEIDSKHDDGKYGTSTSVVIKYLTNLVFQKFAKEFKVRQKIDSAKATQLKSEMKGLDEQAKVLRRLKAPSAEQSLKLQGLESELKWRREIIGLKFIPQEGALKAYAEKNINARDRYKAEHALVSKRLEVLKKELDSLKQKEKENQKLINAEIEAYKLSEQGKEDKDILEMDHRLELVKQKMSQYAKLTQSMTLAEYEGKLELLETLKPQAVERAKEFYSLFQDYSAQKNKVLSLWGAKAESGILGLMAQVHHFEMHNEDSGLEKKLLATSGEIEQLEQLRRSLYAANDKLESEYIQKVVPDMYTEKLMSFDDILDVNSLDELLSLHGPVLKELWEQWVGVWKEAPASDKTSLY